MAAKRDYKHEASKESPKRKADRRKRMKARYDMMKRLTAKHGAAKAAAMMKGKDVDHVKPLSQGGSNSASNLRLRNPKENQSDKRMFKGKRTTRPEARKKKQ